MSRSRSRRSRRSSRSGQNVIVVPVSVLSSARSSGACGTPPSPIRLPPDVALASNLDLEPRRQRVHDGRADTVQTTRDRIAAATELSAGVQHREDDLDGGLALGACGCRRGCRDRCRRTRTPPSGRIVTIDRVAIAGEGLVDGVVDDLVARGGGDRAVRSSRCTCRGACEPPRGLREPGSRQRRTRRESVRLALVPRNAVRVARAGCRGSQTS